jgi:hypothetical protein
VPVFRFAHAVRSLSIGLLILAAACATPPPATPGAAAVAATDAALEAQAAADEAEQATALAFEVATQVASTLTAQPTSTPTETHTASPEPTDTDTPRPTATDTPEATATETSTPRPTVPAVTLTPTAPPAPASVYSEVGGPANFFTFIDCTRGGAQCTPEMPTGDISFDFYLASDAAAPFAVFLPYGLSVEKDGVNVANMFMFVDAGYLPPDTIVRFGASRNFTSPGRYVIRSSSCMTISEAPCGWTTMAGTVVTFVIK